jgi:hypothetical protein
VVAFVRIDKRPEAAMSVQVVFSCPVWKGFLNKFLREYRLRACLGVQHFERHLAGFDEWIKRHIPVHDTVFTDDEVVRVCKYAWVLDAVFGLGSKEALAACVAQGWGARDFLDDPLRAGVSHPDVVRAVAWRAFRLYSGSAAAFCSDTAAEFFGACAYLVADEVIVESALPLPDRLRFALRVAPGGAPLSVRATRLPPRSFRSLLTMLMRHGGSFDPSAVREQCALFAGGGGGDGCFQALLDEAIALHAADEVAGMRIAQLLRANEDCVRRWAPRTWLAVTAAGGRVPVLDAEIRRLASMQEGIAV